MPPPYYFPALTTGYFDWFDLPDAQYKKATKAAARYLKDLYSTDTQASGFLVMACYNWGEGRVLPLVRSMSANPRERKLWRPWPTIATRFLRKPTTTSS